jgi:ADP-ribosylglycohydrolase
MRGADMIGSICGDIIGSVFEWHNVKNERFELFSNGSRFTDDTVMTVAVAEKLLSCENLHGIRNNAATAKAYAAHYRQYYSRYPYAGFGQMFTDWAKNGNFAKQKSYANGAAMRVAPIGYAFGNINAVIKEARLSCLYTHNHREAIRGAEVVAGCVFLARTDASKDQIQAFVHKQIGYRHINFILDNIRSDYKFDSRTSYSIPPAISAFLESDDYESAIRKAISIGGDSDTIACIAGGIAHAFYKSIPKPIYDKWQPPKTLNFQKLMLKNRMKSRLVFLKTRFSEVAKCMTLLDSGLKKTVKDFLKTYNVPVLH